MSQLVFRSIKSLQKFLAINQGVDGKILLDVILDDSDTPQNPPEYFFKCLLEVNEFLSQNNSFTGKIVLMENNGKKSIEWNYANGKLHGKVTCWFDNGVKDFESNYVNGVMHGKAQSWYLSGDIRSDNLYVNGKSVPKSL